MKENREAYEDLADRAVQLLAAVANTISKASPDKLKGMEGNVARLLLCVLDHVIWKCRLTQPSSTLQEIKLAADTRLHAPASTRKRDALKKLIRSKGKDVSRVSEDQEETKKLGAQLDRAVEELNVRILVSHSRVFVLILVTRSLLRSAWNLSWRKCARSRWS
jgi:hypothetical protein